MGTDIQTEVKTTNCEAVDTVKCLNCGNEFQGNFCPKCGQSADTTRFTMRFIFENLLAAFISKDGGIWFTLKNLFTRPGEMIVEILDGKRRRYFSPFPMLLCVLTIYILMFSLTGSRSDIKELEHELLELEISNVTDNATDTSLYEASKNEFFRMVGMAFKFYNNHYTTVFMLTLPLFLLVARAWYGKINRKRYYRAEYIVAITYSMVMVVLYRCLVSLIYPFSEHISETMGNWMPMVIVVAFTACFRKMLGFSIVKTAWRSLLAVVLYYMLLAFVIVSVLVIYAIFILQLY